MSVTAIKEIIKMLENPSLINIKEEKNEVLENGDIVLKRCEKCGEIIDYIHEGYTMTRDCACMRSYRVQAKLKRFQDLSITDRNSKSDIFSNSKKITNAEERAIYEELYNYANNFNISKKGYIFSGGVGTGKTFLANCVCNQLSEKGFSVLSFSLGAYFNKIRFSTDEEEKLIGIITVDDAIDVIDEEATSDYSGLAGVDVDEQSVNPFIAASKRLPWLISLLFLGLTTAALLSRYEGIIGQVSVLFLLH